MNGKPSFFTTLDGSSPNIPTFTLNEPSTGGAKALPFLLGANHNQQNNFDQITFADICDKVCNPPTVDKSRAPIFLPSSATAKTKKAIISADSMTALVVDLDSGNLALSAIEQALQTALVECYCVYSTKSATAENPRWRVVVPILNAIPCQQWQDMQKALSGLFGSAADDCTHRVTQISYLPNRGEYYEHSIRKGLPLDCSNRGHPLVIKSLDIMQQREQAQRQREQEAKPAQRTLSHAHGSTIAAYNDAHTITELLTCYHFKNAGGKWLHPASTSGIPGITLLDGRYYSHHSQTTDPLADGFTHDTFDLFVQHEHNGDINAALQAAGDELVNSEGLTVNKGNQREYMQQREQVLITEALTQPTASNTPSEVPKTREALDLSGVRIEQPHGLAGLMVDYMRDMAERELAMSYPALALQVLSAVSPAHTGYNNTLLGLITLVIADTASGKNVGQTFFKMVMRDLNMAGILKGGVRSDKDVITNLVESEGKVVYLIDEIHSLFNSMSSPKAETYQSNIAPLMLQLATDKTYILSGLHQREFREKTEKELCRIETQLADPKANNDIINALNKRKQKLERTLDKINNGFPNVGFSLAGCSTPRNLDKIVSPDNIESGMIGRSLLFRCDEDISPLKDTVENSDRWTEILTRLNTISRGNIHEITATPEAKKDLSTVRSFYDRLYYRNHPQLGALYRRLYERVTAVASILAVESGEITQQDVRYALAVVLRHIDDVGYLARKNESESSLGDESELVKSLTETVKRFLKDGEKYVSQLKNKLKVYAKMKAATQAAKKAQQPDPLEGFISKLVADGVIVLSNDGKRCRLA